RAAGKDQQLNVLGTLTVQGEGLAATLGANLLLMPIAEAAPLEFPGRPDLATRVHLTLDAATRGNPAAVKEVRSHVETVVGPRAEVSTPEAMDRSLQDGTAGLELGFDLGGAGALVVGLFLVYNALSYSVAERRHDIGILRSQGATRGQVAGLFTFEAG